MAMRVLTTIVILLCVNSAVSFFDFEDIANSTFVIKGFSIACTGDERSEFQCGDVSNSCIYDNFVCDGIIDCPNGEDESPARCEADWTKICEVDRRTSFAKPFQVATCNNTMCISECDMCDGYYIDCADGSDEDPDLCSGDNRPQIIGDCSKYRESYPIPETAKILPTTLP